LAKSKPQNEPASKLLKRIKSEKDKPIKEKKIKKENLEHQSLVQQLFRSVKTGQTGYYFLKKINYIIDK